MTLPCTVCHRTDVAPWNLHIRSVLFEQVAWCDPCWDARPLIPAQRVPARSRFAFTVTAKGSASLSRRDTVLDSDVVA